MKFPLLALISVETVQSAGAYKDFESRQRIPLEETPPHLNEDFAQSEVYGDKGRSLKLRCPIESEDKTLYSWWKDDEEINSFWSWFRLSGRTLKIRKLSSNTVGRYRCKGTNGYGSLDFSFDVRVEGDKLTKYSGKGRVLLNGGLRNVTVNEGDPVRLTCILQYYKKLKVKWVKLKQNNFGNHTVTTLEDIRENNIQILGESADSRFAINNGYQVQKDHYVYRLSVLSAQLEDAGSYMCMVFLPGATKIDEAFDYQEATVEVNPANKPADLFQSKYRSGMLTVLAVLLPLVFVLLVITIVLVWKTKYLSTQCCGDRKHRSEMKEEIPREESKTFLGDNVSRGTARCVHPTQGGSRGTPQTAPSCRRPSRGTTRNAPSSRGTSRGIPSLSIQTREQEHV